MHFPVTRLLRLDIVTKDGHITNYSHLNDVQEGLVIKKLIKVLSSMTAEEFLKINRFTPIFPDTIVYMIIRDNKEKLMKSIILNAN